MNPTERPFFFETATSGCGGLHHAKIASAAGSQTLTGKVPAKSVSVNLQIIGLGRLIVKATA
jgi:hypothetical protein